MRATQTGQAGEAGPGAGNSALAELREEIEASEVPLERIVVRPGSADEEDDAELVLGKGSREEELLSLMDGLRRVSGVREVSSALTNGSAESKPEQ
jgi:hypothetical protein